MSDKNVLSSYDARQEQELADFVEESRQRLKASATTPLTDPAQPPGVTAAPAAEPQSYIGGALTSVTRSVRAAGSAMVERYTGSGKKIADAVYPASPDGPRGTIGRAWDATTGAIGVLSTPLAGVGSVVGDVAGAAAHYTGSMTDEALRTRLADIASGKDAGIDSKSLVEKLLSMKYEDRIKYTHDAGAVAGEVVAGFVTPSGIIRGVSRALGVSTKAIKAGTVEGALSDATLTARLKVLKEGGSAADPVEALQDTKLVEDMLARPYADRLKYVADEAKNVVEGATTANKVGSGVAKAADAVDNAPVNAPAAVGREASPNVAYMDVSENAKAGIQAINKRMEEAGNLERSTVQTHEATVELSKASPMRKVENILAHDDAAPMAAHDLTAARAVRDQTLRRADETVAAFERGEATGEQMRETILQMGAVSKKVTNAQTALSRGVEAGKIITEEGAPLAQAFDVERWSRSIQEISDHLPASDAELAAMFRSTKGAEQRLRLAEGLAQQPNALWEIYYGISLLSSPATHVANLVGNSVAVVTSVPTRLAGEMIAPIFRGLGSKTAHVAPGESWEMVNGMIDHFGDALRAVKTSWQSGKSTLEGSGKAGEMLQSAPSAPIPLGDDATLYAKFIDTMATLARAPGAAARGVMKGMSSSDEFFKVLQYNGELRALARREAYESGLTGKALRNKQMELMASPTQTMRDGALAFAKEQTFSKEFTDGSGLWASKLAGSTAARLTVAPFFRTPVRLMEYGSVHTPGLNFVTKQFYSDMAEGGAKAELAVAKLAVGSGVMSMAWTATTQGYLTGAGPTDPVLRKAMEKAGWQEFSWYSPTTGTYHSYKPILAVLPMVGLAASAAEMAPHLQDHDINTLTSALVISTARGALSQPFWSGVSDLFDAGADVVSHGSTDKLDTFIQRRLLAPVPAALRGAARAVDPVKRDVKATGPGEGTFEGQWKEIQVLMKSLQANVPGWSSSLPAESNPITGEPVMRPAAIFGSPFTHTVETKNPTLLEIVRLDGAGLPPETRRAIGVKTSKGDLEPIQLSADERAHLIRLTTKTERGGKTMQERMRDRIESTGYQHLQDIDKAEQLREIYNDYDAQAVHDLQKARPELEKIVVQREQQRALGHIPR